MNSRLWQVFDNAYRTAVEVRKEKVACQRIVDELESAISGDPRLRDLPYGRIKESCNGVQIQAGHIRRVHSRG